MVPSLPCIGCGALVPDIDGPTHEYIGASPGCWQIYGEVLAREYGEYRMPPIHRLTVDTYAVQHPGVPGRKSRQSVAVHLMSLCLVLERNMAPERATRALGPLTQRGYPWLDPPASMGPVTVLDVRAAGSLPEHVQAVEHWARSAWDAWSVHHEAVRSWLETALVG